MVQEDLFKGYGVEVTLKHTDDFLKIRETLQRMGIASKKNNTLYQSCHILHKKGQYAILHFKELFSLDGKHTNISDNDIGRRNRIVKLLEDWNLLTINESFDDDEPMVPIGQIKIIPFKDKDKWVLSAKYSIGKTKV